MEWTKKLLKPYKNISFFLPVLYEKDYNSIQMKKVLFTILLSFSFLFSIQTFAATGDSFDIDSRTLGELTEELKIDKQQIQDEIMVIDPQLSSFFSESYTHSQLLQIRKTVQGYINSFGVKKDDFLNSAGEIKRQNKDILIDAKKDFYNTIRFFIAKDKRAEYDEYTDNVLRDYTNRLEKEIEVQEKELLIDKKKQVLQQKYDIHKQEADNVFRNILEKKLKPKVKSIVLNDRFQKLEKKSQVKVLDSTISSYSQKQQNFIEKSKGENSEIRIIKNEKIVDMYDVLLITLQEIKVEITKK